MKNSPKFFICNHCGNLIGFIKASGVPIVCCGENMHELTPNTVDATVEKHVPVVTEDCNCDCNCDCCTCLCVQIGSTLHPAEPEHYIEWVYVETKNGGQRKALSPGDKPSTCFCICNDEAVALYAYCNIHGLWKADV